MTKTKKALITGITGQDGSYLAEFLLHKGYEVHGIIRRASTFNTGRIDHIYQDPHDPNASLRLHHGDLSDSEQIANLLQNVSPDEVYNLGAQSHVKVSFDVPEYTSNVTGIGPLRILEAIKRSGKKVKFYQASSSEMFGNSPAPQNEDTTMRPASPYGTSKLKAHLDTINYRNGSGIFACNGILFNHESPRRGETFVTRKITRAIAKIRAGKQDKIYLGNLDAQRDWGFAPEYVEAMHQILQQPGPNDYVIGTGERHSIREFLDLAFKYSELHTKKHFEIDENYFRPIEVNVLLADYSKARRELNWNPKINFNSLVKIMIDADLRAIGLQSRGEGDEILKETFPDRWWQAD